MANELHVPTEREVQQDSTAAADVLLRKAAEVEVHDEQGLISATEYATRISAALKHQEDARVRLVKPLNDHVRWINGTFRQATHGPLEVLTQLKSKISDYHNAKRAEAERLARESAELAEAERAAREAGLVSDDAPTAVALDQQPVRTAGHSTSGSAHVAERWDYEVTNIGTLAAAHPDMVEPNRGAIRRALNAGLREIPGVRIFKTTDVQVRRNSR